MDPKKKQKIAVVSDIEALEYTRRQMSAIVAEQENAEDAGTGTVDPLASRALSELDRLIDKGKT